MDDRFLEVQDLKMYFPVRTSLFKSTPLKAVDGVSFTIPKGKTLGLVGESGCGKSTVGRTVLQLYKPTGGQVLFKGKPPEADMARFRKEAAMVFQDPYSSLDPRMSVLDLIAEPLDIHRLCKSSAERRDRVLELMEQVGLNRRLLSRFPHEFSGGQRQRIVIARALATNPKLLMCDEAVSALDVSVRAQTLNLLETLQQDLKLTYMFISHDLSVIEHICDRVAIMYLGKIVEIGTKDEIFNNPKHPYTQALLSAIPVVGDNGPKRERILLEGDIPSPVNPPSGCRFHTRCKYATERCKTQVPKLAEIGNSHNVACFLCHDCID